MRGTRGRAIVLLVATIPTGMGVRTRGERVATMSMRPPVLPPNPGDELPLPLLLVHPPPPPPPLLLRQRRPSCPLSSATLPLPSRPAVLLWLVAGGGDAALALPLVLRLPLPHPLLRRRGAGAHPRHPGHCLSRSSPRVAGLPPLRLLLQHSPPPQTLSLSCTERHHTGRLLLPHHRPPRHRCITCRTRRPRRCSARSGAQRPLPPRPPIAALPQLRLARGRGVLVGVASTHSPGRH